MSNNEFILILCGMLLLALTIRDVFKKKETYIPAQCNNKNNLTGLCLRRDRCKTSSDCEYMVEEPENR
jgi:hypothetical protein